MLLADAPKAARSLFCDPPEIYDKLDAFRCNAVCTHELLQKGK